MMLNETHDPSVRSWVSSANAAGADFPLQNLPFGIFRRRGNTERFRGGVAIGDQILDLDAAGAREAFAQLRPGAAASRALSCARRIHAQRSDGDRRPDPLSELRRVLSRALRQGSRIRRPGALPGASVWRQRWLCRRRWVTTPISTPRCIMRRRSASSCGPTPLLPNYKWVPIGYHGRSSSIGVSGQMVQRPLGQRLPAGGDTPIVGPSERLDYELELGVFVGSGNERSRPSRSHRPSRMSSDCVCSMTGPRATCRPGSTSRWDPSWARISRRRFPRGS